jgi:hypothetical protein
LTPPMRRGWMWRKSFAGVGQPCGCHGRWGRWWGRRRSVGISWTLAEKKNPSQCVK